MIILLHLWDILQKVCCHAGGVKYTFICFQYPQTTTTTTTTDKQRRSQVHFCLIPRTATTNSNNKQQKAMGVNYTFVCFQHKQTKGKKNNNNVQLKPCWRSTMHFRFFTSKHFPSPTPSCQCTFHIGKT